jgi:hypothetical protein
VLTAWALSHFAMTARPNHCCPVCSHPVGVKRWFWSAWIWARWNCKSCGTLLRFDFRRRLLFGLYMGLLFMAVLGIAAACILVRISAWIWGVPLLATYIVSFILVVRHGDRVAVATTETKRG